VASGRRAPALLVGALLVVLVATGLAPASARPERPAPVGSDPFMAGQPYRGDFPDPTVWRVGRRYYAAATTVAALNLPVMTSADLRTWTARSSSDPARPSLNDAMPTPPAWAQTQVAPGGRTFISTWAPSVLRISNGTFVAAYSVPRASDGRRCISLARSASPMGPYVDSSSGPISCGTAGVIDPQLFVERRGIWMAYKMEGAPDRILTRPMNTYATGFAVGSRNYSLLTPRTAWEGSVVENPSMIRYRKRLYLFYSANNYGSASYATGYAVCRRVTGPCTGRTRILATGRYLAGPGGGLAFVDLAGQLRLAFHAWTTGNVGYPSADTCRETPRGCAQRRLHLAQLGVTKRGRVAVRSWF
jgi:beta-xylosidase